LDKVWFVPAASAPHKLSRGPAAAPAAKRLDMLRLATGGNADFDVCELELLRGGTSYTVDTLAAT